MGDSDFNDLVNAAEQLASEVEGSGELPRVERTLRQVLEASHELWARVTTTGPQDIQANLLLGSKGVDLPQLSQKLESLSSRKTFEPLDPVPDNDIHSYLKNEAENAILSLIETTHKRTINNLTKEHRKKIMWEWKVEKAKLLNSLIGRSGTLLQLPRRTEKTVLNESVYGTKSCLDQLEMAYAQCLIEYNTALLEGSPKPNLVDKFSRVAASSNDSKVNEMWTIVSYMTQLQPQGQGDVLEARNSEAGKSKLIGQARKYLENRYRQYMESVVSSNLSTARRGGEPSTYSLVRSFVGLRVPGGYLGLDPASVDGRPLWACVYYYLRCGDLAGALQCVQQAGPGLEEMSVALQELKGSSLRRLSPPLEKAINSQYKRGVRNSTDPYKRVVYCILGACDVTDEHSEVIKTADDYLWLKLCQVRDSDASTSDCITYSLLQTLVLEEYGEQHYSAKEQPHVYFQLLFLTGQWEAAVDFLMRTNRLATHGVHIAILLHQLGLLATPANVKAPLLYVDPADPKPMHRINLVRLVMIYVQKFEGHNIFEALHYYYCLRNFKSLEGDDMFPVCVCGLLMETRAFDYVLGALEPDGCKVPGLIDQFKGNKADREAVTEMVASQAEQRGEYEIAIKLYDLIGMHEEVLRLMSTLMVQLVARVDNEPSSLRSRLSEFAQQLSARYSGIKLKASAKTTATFFCLRDLLIFFDQYAEKKYQLALDTIQRSRLIPLVVDEIESMEKLFHGLAEEVVRVIPDVLLATMNILYAQYTKLKGESQPMTGDLQEAKERQLSFLRQRAHALTMYAGKIPYRMPGDTNARLVQMEILMN
ncbi:nuclear pore complex protein Nup93-like [Macrosteles quadrilineatus]|uniref:nuclear pore complex protein Nup93-like n=1 Tax=Macrosteles quadrilineatus TaxID=74068 RepID=UPI0023E16C17|nr:nuclear pore complex protein Nup93-like [Macrosteles quadrilineatus]